MRYPRDPDPTPDEPTRACKSCAHWDRLGDGTGLCGVDRMEYVTYPDDACSEHEPRPRL